MAKSTLFGPVLHVFLGELDVPEEDWLSRVGDWIALLVRSSWLFWRILTWIHLVVEK